jgi:hypothetical protein
MTLVLALSVLAACGDDGGAPTDAGAEADAGPADTGPVDCIGDDAVPAITSGGAAASSST